MLLKGNRQFLSLALVFVLQAGLTFAADPSFRERLAADDTTPWEITASKVSYDEAKGLIIAEGDVEISRPGQSFSTQRAVYNQKTGIVEVSGGFRLQADGDTISGEQGRFDLNTHTGRITAGSLFLQENNFHVRGSAIEKTGPNTYKVKDCRLTTCDGVKPAWSVTGSEVEVTLEGYGTVKDAAFRVSDVPILYFPYAIYPVKTKRQTGLLFPRAGYSNINGLEFELPFFWAISDQTDATFYGRFMSDRGYMQGVEFRHVTGAESKGVQLFDILSDRIEVKDLADPDQVQVSSLERTNSTRYWLRGRLDQDLPAGLQARLDTDYVSDQDYLYEFGLGLYGHEARPDLMQEFGRPLLEIQSPTRPSNFRLSYDKADYTLQVGSSYEQLPANPAIDPRPQPLAGFNFALLPRPTPQVPLFFRFNTEHDYVWREDGIKGHRIAATPAVSYPVWLVPFLRFEPSLSYTWNGQWFDNPQEDTNWESRETYDIRADLSSIIDRVYEVGWAYADKVKHRILPSLAYEFRAPEDGDRFRPWFEPLVAEGKQNRVVFSLENRLDARKDGENGSVEYFQWGTFFLSQPYNIDVARADGTPLEDDEPFEPLTAVLRLDPFPGLTLLAEGDWDWQQDTVSFADLSFEYKLDRAGDLKDIFVINYERQIDGSDTLNAYVHVNLIHGVSLGTALGRDLTEGQTVQSSFWLDYQAQCWGVRLRTYSLDDIGSVMLTFRLTGVGEL